MYLPYNSTNVILYWQYQIYKNVTNHHIHYKSIHNIIYHEEKLVSIRKELWILKSHLVKWFYCYTFCPGTNYGQFQHSKDVIKFLFVVIQRPEKRCSYKCVEHRLSSNLFKELTDNIESFRWATSKDSRAVDAV